MKSRSLPRLRPQRWPWSGPRVLLEHPDADRATRLAAGLREAGYAVAVCTGPLPHDRCPLAGRDGCAAADGADVIVSALGLRSSEARDALAALRLRLPSTPLLVEAPSQDVARWPELVEGCDLLEPPASPARLVESVRAAVEGHGASGLHHAFAGEAVAFRVLLASVAAVAAVGAAALLGGAIAALLVAAGVVLAALVARAASRRHARVLRTAPAHVGARERRLLVLAQSPLADEQLAAIPARADRVLVVTAAEAPPLRAWASDTDRARLDARRLVDATVSRLRTLRADAEGVVGDGDPVQAIEDALRTFGGDEIVVSSSRGRNDVVERLRERFAVPVSRAG